MQLYCFPSHFSMCLQHTFLLVYLFEFIYFIFVIIIVYITTGVRFMSVLTVCILCTIILSAAWIVLLFILFGCRSFCLLCAFSVTYKLLSLLNEKKCQTWLVWLLCYRVPLLFRPQGRVCAHVCVSMPVYLCALCVSMCACACCFCWHHFLFFLFLNRWWMGG